MAALCPGVQYGLSSQENFGENKDLIFVKLTDSALRAIEDYLKNQGKFNKTPTIKFLGNEGQLCFPSQHNGSTSFSFSMSSTADMEGPGGGFECAQQSPRGSLGVLGPIPHKIRIHANDDVYETTRHRMTVAEENHKNKCAREIKMNQNDIGRKVKLKQVPGRTVPPIRRDTPPLRDSLSSKSSYPPSQQPSKQQQQQQQPISHNNINHVNHTSITTPPTVNNGLSNGLGSNHVSSTKPPQNKPSMPDIARRPIKERMIHLLALRPFKKPELYERLTKEGLRERNAMTSVLKQIAALKDNSYHLNRMMWNEVNEDWPFYTESEKQMLKRRKPQNLTPPGGSDGGSSGSGHSPTSTHPGSPPPPPTSSSKRPGYVDGADGLPTKRQRISHYRKPSEPVYRSPAENNSQRRPMTDSRDASNMNPRSRESPLGGGYTPTNGYNTANNEKRGLSDDEDAMMTTFSNRKRACDSHTALGGLETNRESKTLDTNSRSITPPKHIDEVRIERSEISRASTNSDISRCIDSRIIDTRNNSHETAKPDRLTPDTRIKNNDTRNNIDDTRSNLDSARNDSRKIERTNDTRHLENTIRTNDNRTIDMRNNERNETRNKEMSVQRSPPITNGVITTNGRTNKMEERERRDKDRWNKVSSTQQNNRIARVSPDSQSDRILPPAVEVAPAPEFPDYTKEYGSIVDVNQRRRYKAEFNADYAEYRELHGVVEKVSRRFAELEESLKQEDSSSNRYKDIKKQIVKEYQQNQKDKDHQRAKRRFQYLHDKLSHIKHLVFEYDRDLPDNQY